MSHPASPPARPLVVLLASLLPALALSVGACAAPAEEPPPEPAAGELRQMAVTIDDLPVAPPGRHTTAQQAEITDRLLAALAAHDAPAIGFVNESKLEVDGAVDPLRAELLERWLAAGHELGNHGYARPTHGHTGPGGITWLHRWAITEGRDPEIFGGEPEVPEWVREMADGL